MASVWVLSDLHLEFAPFDPVPPEADVLVAAGDIGVGLAGLEYLKRFAPMPVVYVAGNHEYYGDAIPHLTRKLREQSAGTNVHFLENEAVELAGVRFLGCTLWTDFGLFGAERRQEAMMVAREGMSDFKVIRRSPEFRKFTPTDAYALHRESRRWIADELAKHEMPTVVVTHHAPHRELLNLRYGSQVLSAAFASNCSDLLASNGISWWVSGHTHRSLDGRIGSTRVVSNQRGYPGERGTFDPRLVIDV